MGTKKSEFDLKVDELRLRDKELGNIAITLGLAKKVDEVTNENNYLRVVAEEYFSWRKSNTFKIARMITKTLGPIKRMLRK